MVFGVSVGFVVGVLYVVGFSLEEMLQFIEESSFLKLVKFGILSGGLSKFIYLCQCLDEVILVDDFDELKYLLFVVIINFNSGVFELKSKGFFYDIVMVFCSILLVF